MMFESFLCMLLHYIVEIAPALAVGFFISGLVHELIPENMVVKYLGSGNIMPILWATMIGTFLPVCCWGSLPIAVSFYKKGARLGPVLAFLVATPATSISALLVTYSLLGLRFAVYTFFAVIVMGVVTGLIGNMIKAAPKKIPEEKARLLAREEHAGGQARLPAGEGLAGGQACPHCEKTAKKTLFTRAISILRYAYIDLPKEIGLELIIGIVLAAFVASFIPLGHIIKLYLGGPAGYLFSIVFGVLMYLCATASVPLVDSLIRQGMNIGAGMTLLLIGPITSYGTLLVLRKEYGMKTLVVFLASLIILSLIAGLGFQFFI